MQVNNVVVGPARPLGRLSWALLGAWIWAAASALLLLAPAAGAATLVVSPQGSPLSLSDAVQRANDGDTIELLPGEYPNHLLLDQRRLTFRGVLSGAGKRPVIQGGGKIGSAKAMWIVRGGDVTLENLEFRGSRSAQGEGAGVRLEGGRLQVQRSVFQDNEHGIVASHDAKATLLIEDSEFGLAPKVVGGLYHLLNVGRIAKLQVSGSRFQQGFEGHLIKTRARENLILYNFIHDGLRGGASYEIEIAAGGLATVLGNVIGQGSDTQNPVLVAYGTEAPAWDKNSLAVVHNTFVNYGWVPAWFVRVIHKNLPPDAEVVVVNNLLVGPGLLWPAVSGVVAGNRHIFRAALRDADTYAFELQPSSTWRGSAIEPPNFDGRDLTPKAEFVWPTGTVAIKPTPGRWAPGAYQR